MGTVTRFDAENASSGTAVSAANMPAAAGPTLTGGSTMTFDSAAAYKGNCGYRMVVAAASQCLIRVNPADSLTQRLRFAWKPVSQAGSRPILDLRPSGARAIRLGYSATNFWLRNSADAAEATGPAISMGTWYIVTGEFLVDTTSTGKYRVRLHDAATRAQVGSLMTSDVYNMGTASVIEADVGTNNTAAGACEYYIDALWLESDDFTPLNPFPTPNVSRQFARFAAAQT